MTSNALTDHPVFVDWHPTRNTDTDPATVTFGMGLRVWWLCHACGHEWQATVVSRARRANPAGCPDCGRRARSERQSALGAARNPLSGHPVAQELARGRNPNLDPTQVAAASRLHAWWQCPDCGHQWNTRISHRTSPTSGHGCPRCSATSTGAGFTATAAASRPLSEHPISSQWHPTLNGPLTPEQVPTGARAMVWWKCPRGHEWEAKVTNRTRAKSVGCPECASIEHGDVLRGRGVLQRETVAARPELLAQWHPTRNGALDPSQATCGSRRKVWWKCAQGHEWEAGIANRAKRTNPSGCPDCAQVRKSAIARAAAAGRDPLAKTGLAAEWHPTKNTVNINDLSAASSARVWWLCGTCGHEWEAKVTNRASSGTGCPQCGRAAIRAARETRSAATNPLTAAAAAKLWHPTRNEPITPDQVSAGSSRRFWWQCPQGHEWEATAKNLTRADRPSGCPTCGAAAAGRAISAHRRSTS